MSSEENPTSTEQPKPVKAHSLRGQLLNYIQTNLPELFTKNSLVVLFSRFDPAGSLSLEAQWKAVSQAIAVMLERFYKHPPTRRPCVLLLAPDFVFSINKKGEPNDNHLRPYLSVALLTVNMFDTAPAWLSFLKACNADPRVNYRLGPADGSDTQPVCAGPSKLVSEETVLSSVTFLAEGSNARSSMVESRRSLYVSPVNTQIKQFANMLKNHNNKHIQSSIRAAVPGTPSLTLAFSSSASDVASTSSSVPSNASASSSNLDAANAAGPSQAKSPWDTLRFHLQTMQARLALRCSLLQDLSSAGQFVSRLLPATVTAEFNFSSPVPSPSQSQNPVQLQLQLQSQSQSQSQSSESESSSQSQSQSQSPTAAIECPPTKRARLEPGSSKAVPLTISSDRKAQFLSHVSALLHASSYRFMSAGSVDSLVLYKKKPGTNFTLVEAEDQDFSSSPSDIVLSLLEDNSNLKALRRESTDNQNQNQHQDQNGGQDEDEDQDEEIDSQQYADTPILYGRELLTAFAEEPRSLDWLQDLNSKKAYKQHYLPIVKPHPTDIPIEFSDGVFYVRTATFEPLESIRKVPGGFGYLVHAYSPESFQRIATLAQLRTNAPRFMEILENSFPQQARLKQFLRSYSQLFKQKLRRDLSLFCVGQPGSGKSTIFEVFQAILGHDSIAVLTKDKKNSLKYLRGSHVRMAIFDEFDYSKLDRDELLRLLEGSSITTAEKWEKTSRVKVCFPTVLISNYPYIYPVQREHAELMKTNIQSQRQLYMPWLAEEDQENNDNNNNNNNYNDNIYVGDEQRYRPAPIPEFTERDIDIDSAILTRLAIYFFKALPNPDKSVIAEEIKSEAPAVAVFCSMLLNNLTTEDDQNQDQNQNQNQNQESIKAANLSEEF